MSAAPRTNINNRGEKKGPGVRNNQSGKETEPSNDDRPQHQPSDKELLLQKELETIEDELRTSKERVKELRQENEWLQEEAGRVRIENQEYMSYVDKKTSKRQSSLISLNDYHRHQITKLQREREKLEQEFAAKRQVLQATLLEKESELARINRELDGLHEYKMLHEEQRAQVRDLEREIIELRNKHSESIRQLKSSFVNEKKSFEMNSQTRLDDIARQANREAMQCLIEQTTKVSEDNRRLRHELLTLIRHSQALHNHKRSLLEQRQKLLLECQYSEDLRAIRGIGGNSTNHSGDGYIS